MTTAPQILPTNAPNVYDIPLSLLVRGKNVRTVEINPNRFEEMKESFKKNGNHPTGQISPIEVVRLASGKFEVTAGFTRSAAAEALEWPTIRAQVTEIPTTGPLKGNADLFRKLRGLTENLAREDLTPFDQSMNFLDLKKNHDMSGVSIGQYVGRSTSYVNNLMRIAEACEPVILDRWRKESDPQFGKDKDGKRLPNIHAVCTMDWLVDVAANVPRVEQDMALKKALGLIPDDEDDGDDDEKGSNRAPKDPGAPKRASMKVLKEAFDAAGEAKKAGDKSERLVGILEGLKFAIGTNATIKGIYSPKTTDKE